MQQEPTPEMPPFSPAVWRGPAGAPSPISSRPPAPGQQQQMVAAADELGGGGGAAASASGSGSLDGEEGGSSAAGGNRWPREETLALLKIRSDMDAAFREAALKGPLWEQVSRRIGEMGYKRSGKKCREKFENVDKYYRRTKDGRAGRAHGKTYRFFSELEALHSISISSSAAHPPPLPALAPPPSKLPAPSPPLPTATCAMAAPGASLSSLGGSDGSETDDDEIAAEGSKKRKRHSSNWSGITTTSSGGGGGKKKQATMRLFEGMMRQVMERQEAMQQRLLDAIERRDQERLAREESWRRGETARLAREQDALARDRAAAAARDAAVVSFIHRVTGQMAVLPPPPPETKTATKAAMLKRPPPAPPLQPTTPRNQPQQPHVVMPMSAPASASAPARAETSPAQSNEVVAVGGVDTAAAASRWPKAEVHALIELRTEMEARYGNGGGGGHETPNKGPLWEDIAAGMRRLGYARSSKRCKEKWENINKYFKKVKESSRSKQRPVDSKTCPYFHQLDKLYRTKAQNAAAASQSPTAVTVLAAVPLSSQTPAPHIVEHGPGKNLSNGNGNSNGMQAKASNGNGTAAANKLESKQDGMITKETTTEQHPQPAGSPMAPMNHNLNNYGNGRTEVMHDDMDDIDSMDDDDDFDSDDEDDAIGGGRNEQVQSYDIRFQSQQQQQQHQNTNGGGNPPAAPASAAAASGAAPAPFLAMVQ